MIQKWFSTVVLVVCTLSSTYGADLKEEVKRSDRVGFSLSEEGVSETADIRNGYYIKGSIEYLVLENFLPSVSYSINPFDGPVQDGLLSLDFKYRNWRYADQYSTAVGVSYVTNTSSFGKSNYIGLYVSPLTSWSSILNNRLSPMISFLSTRVYVGLESQQILLRISFFDLDLFF